MAEHKQFPFYYLAHRLEAPEKDMQVSALKALIKAAVPEFDISYTLVIEERGDHPDRPLNDTDAVEIKDFPHVYSQPPANFG